MEHLSEVLKILDGALKSNIRMAIDYAGLLADKLEADGDSRQAAILREKLSRAPQQLMVTQEAKYGLPVDKDSRLHVVDESRPTEAGIRLILSPIVDSQVSEFVASVQKFDELSAAGAPIPSRLLLHGPPGCGKTQLAHLIAARLNLPLLTVRCDTLVSSLLGQSSRNLRMVFDHAESRPCVLFLDEFDALAKTRNDQREVGELQRIVIALLQNIDALSPSTVLIAATNHEELLDRAVWRRFSYQIAMRAPNHEQRKRIWRDRLGAHFSDDAFLDELTALSEGLNGASIELVSMDAIRHMVLSGKTTLDPEELLRRLGRVAAIQQGKHLDSIEEEVRFLRTWLPRVFSLRRLASTFDVSVRQINNMIKDDAHGKAQLTHTDDSTIRD